MNIKCPACNNHELSDRAWLSDDIAMYPSEDHYDCANCGPIPKEYADAVLARIKALETEKAAETELAAAKTALLHIAEYWNRDENELAMADALYYIIDTAESAVAAMESKP